MFLIGSGAVWAHEVSLPIYTAHVDLKMAVERMSRSKVTSRLSCKNVYLLLVTVLCSWWKDSSLDVRLGDAVTEQPVMVDRGELQRDRWKPFGVRRGYW